MTLQNVTVVAVVIFGAVRGWSAQRDVTKDFYDAIRNNDLTTLSALLKSSVVDVRDKRGATPLMYAAATGSIEAMTLLLNAGADVNAKNDFDATPLIWAAGDPAKSRLIIERGANVNGRSKQGRMPLMMAARREGNSQLLRFMLAKGADPDAKDGRGNTALMHAAQAGDVKMMRVLTERGADVNAANLFGATALGNAVCSNTVGAVTFLLGKGANVNAAIRSPGSVRHGPIAIDNLTPLMAAAPYGSAALISQLLRAGAQVNAKDVRGMTPLMLAVASETQDVKVVKLLLRAGADTKVRSSSGETSLDWANKFGSPPVIEALKQAHSQVEGRHPSVSEVVDRTDLDLRKALNRSLGLLQRSSTEYFRESGCVGCHHQLLTAMIVRRVPSAGVHIDEAAAREQSITMKADFESQQELFLQGNDLFGAQVLIPYLFGLNEAGYAADATTDSALADLIALQRTDGSWNRGLAISRAPIVEGNIGRTAQAVRILRAYGPPARRAEIDGRITRARAWLTEAKAHTADDFTMRLAGLAWSGAEKEEIQRAIQSLFLQQRSDGGWAGNPNLSSDAYSTGAALHVLHESGGVAAHDDAYRRGINFLLRTQHDDGAWHVQSRAVKMLPYFESGFPFGDDQWISAAGTAWASIALASALEDDKTYENSR